jgi:hypothetical protein
MNDIDQEYLDIVRATGDAGVHRFMDLVDCEPWEVRDIPSHRLNVPSTYIDPARRQSALGRTEVFFGRHKGKTFEQIPSDYMQWLINQPPIHDAKPTTRKSIEKIKRIAKEFLGDTTASKPKHKRKAKKAKPKPKLKRLCRCTRCGAESMRSRYELQARSQGVRCELCGGNVVEARYTR